jgi:hypothetical protein
VAVNVWRVACHAANGAHVACIQASAVCARLGAQPLTAPAVSPPTRKRCST